MGVLVGLLQCCPIFVGFSGLVSPVGGIVDGGRLIILFYLFCHCGVFHGPRVSVLSMPVHCMWPFGRLV